jgi:hypothetical protein
MSSKLFFLGHMSLLALVSFVGCKTRTFNDQSAQKGFGGAKVPTFSAPTLSSRQIVTLCTTVRKERQSFLVALRGYVFIGEEPRTLIRAEDKGPGQKVATARFEPIFDRYHEAGNAEFYEKDPLKDESGKSFAHGFKLNSLRAGQSFQLIMDVPQDLEVDFQGQEYKPEFTLNFSKREKPYSDGKEIWFLENGTIKYWKFKANKKDLDVGNDVAFPLTPCDETGSDIEAQKAPNFYFDKPAETK